MQRRVVAAARRPLIAPSAFVDVDVFARPVLLAPKAEFRIIASINNTKHAFCSCGTFLVTSGVGVMIGEDMGTGAAGVDDATIDAAVGAEDFWRLKHISLVQYTWNLTYSNTSTCNSSKVHSRSNLKDNEYWHIQSNHHADLRWRRLDYHWGL